MTQMEKIKREIIAIDDPAELAGYLDGIKMRASIWCTQNCPEEVCRDESNGRIEDIAACGMSEFLKSESGVEGLTVKAYKTAIENTKYDNNGRVVISKDNEWLKEKEWDLVLKQVVYIPSKEKLIPFRVEHITDEKFYLVSVDCIGRAKMSDMNKYLNNFMRTLPKSLLNSCSEIEHKVNGHLIRKSKVTLLSCGNTAGCKNCDGIDDMQFDGLKTEAERCKNNENGNTCWYWVDTPYNYETWDKEISDSLPTMFINIGPNGYPYNYGYFNSCNGGVCPVIALKRER